MALFPAQMCNKHRSALKDCNWHALPQKMLEIEVPSQVVQRSKVYWLDTAPSTAGCLPERKEKTSEFISFWGKKTLVTRDCKIRLQGFISGSLVTRNCDIPCYRFHFRGFGWAFNHNAVNSFSHPLSLLSAAIFSFLLCSYVYINIPIYMYM